MLDECRKVEKCRRSDPFSQKCLQHVVGLWSCHIDLRPQLLQDSFEASTRGIASPDVGYAPYASPGYGYGASVTDASPLGYGTGAASMATPPGASVPTYRPSLQVTQQQRNCRTFPAAITCAACTAASHRQTHVAFLRRASSSVFACSSLWCNSCTIESRQLAGPLYDGPERTSCERYLQHAPAKSGP